MNRTTSLYLDVLRISAAAAVFFLHISFRGMTGGFLWQLGIFGSDAVMAFFVLSGYVIAFCAEHKHNSFKDYMVARFARLWSVVVPALILTAIVQIMVSEIAPNARPLPILDLVLSFVLSGLFVNQLWFAHIAPQFDPPFWSIGYEFMYYLFFAAAFYARGKTRFILCAAILAIFGPKMLLLLPIWLIGVLAFRLRGVNLSQSWGWSLWSGSLVAFVLYYALCLKCALNELLGNDALLDNGVFSSADLCSMYIYSIIVFCNIIGFDSIGHHFSHLLERASGAIRMSASYTLSLYLYHFPLIMLFKTLTRGQHGEWSSIAVIYVGTISIVVALAPVTEWRKDVYASVLNRITSTATLQRLLRGRSSPALVVAETRLSSVTDPR